MAGREGTRTPRGLTDAPRTTAAYLAVTALAAPAPLVAHDHAVRVVALVVVQVATVLVVAVGAHAGRRSFHRDWALVLLGTVLAAAGNLAGGPLLRVSPRPGEWVVGSVLSAGSGLVLAVALVRLARREGLAPYAAPWIDTAVYAVASLLLWWVAVGRPLVLAPGRARPETVAAGVLPLTDGVLVVAVGVLLGSRIGRSVTVHALLAYCLLGFVADVGAARAVVDDDTVVPPWIPLALLLQLPLLGLAALTSRRATQTPTTTMPRTAIVLTLGALATPGIVGMYAASNPLLPCDTAGTSVLGGAVSSTCAASLASPTGRVGLATVTVLLVVLGSLLVALLVAMRFRHLVGRLEQQAARLEESARTDELTGLPNRRAGTRMLTAAIAAARREEADPHGGLLAVAVIDLDHFKAYNDTHGHVAGDQLLVETARAWSAALDGATVYRYGGEEFVAVVPGRTLPEAAAVVDGLRAVVPRGQSFSAGLTDLRPGDDVTSLIERADSALYESKAAGRARTTTI